MPWFVETDAWYEVENGVVTAGIGAVLFDSTGRPVQFFSHRLATSLVNALNPNLHRKTTIFECEFFAVSQLSGCGILASLMLQ